MRVLYSINIMGQMYVFTYIPDVNFLLLSALGLTCYECTANETTGELCHNMANYTMKNCSGANAMCAITKIMTVGVPLSAYLLDCFEVRTNSSHVNCSD